MESIVLRDVVIQLIQEGLKKGTVVFGQRKVRSSIKLLKLYLDKENNA